MLHCAASMGFVMRPAAILCALCLAAPAAAAPSPPETALTHRGFPCLAWSDGCVKCRWDLVAPGVTGKICGRPKKACTPGPVICSKPIHLY
jgi:hypothetical protein